MVIFKALGLYLFAWILILTSPVWFPIWFAIHINNELKKEVKEDWMNLPDKFGVKESRRKQTR